MTSHSYESFVSVRIRIPATLNASQFKLIFEVLVDILFICKAQDRCIMFIYFLIGKGIMFTYIDIMHNKHNVNIGIILCYAMPIYIIWSDFPRAFIIPLMVG